MTGESQARRRDRKQGLLLERKQVTSGEGEVTKAHAGGPPADNTVLQFLSSFDVFIQHQSTISLDMHCALVSEDLPLMV